MKKRGRKRKNEKIERKKKKINTLQQSFTARMGEEEIGAFIHQTIRIFNDTDEYFGNFMELSLTIDSIPVTNKEIITRYDWLLLDD